MSFSSETAVEQWIDYEDLAVDDDCLRPESAEPGERFEDEDPIRILFNPVHLPIRWQVA